MKLIINHNIKQFVNWIEYVIPKMNNNFQVEYSGNVYTVKGYFDENFKIKLQDPQKPECLLIVDMNKVKPFLRKMSSMTNQEKEKYQALLEGVVNKTKGVWEVTEWLNENMFDYKDLIGKRLAKEII